jgi:G3E family GTPase
VVLARRPVGGKDGAGRAVTPRSPSRVNPKAKRRSRARGQSVSADDLSRIPDDGKSRQGVSFWSAVAKEVQVFVDVIGGFLGSGKTTTILGLLERREPAEGRTVLLVNEFGQVGVDGAVLESKGDAVRELASGCICCTLRADFVAQLQEISRAFAPHRVIIEPSGVASLKDVLKALQDPSLADHVSGVRSVLVLDADDHDWFVQLSEAFVEAQVGLAQLILVNKVDLSPAELVQEVVADLEKRNPDAVVMTTSYGKFDWSEIEHLLPPLADADGPATRLGEFESYSAELTHTPEISVVRDVFAGLASGRYGDVRRAKGLFAAPGGGLRIDLAGGRVHETAWSSPPVARVNVVGLGLDQEAIARAFGS